VVSDQWSVASETKNSGQWSVVSGQWNPRALIAHHWPPSCTGRFYWSPTT